MSVSGGSLAQHIIEHEILGITNTGGTGPIAASPATNIWIVSSGNAPGNLTLNATSWANRYTYISSINAKTASAKWDLWICETSAFNTSLITSRKIVSSGKGNMLISVNFNVNSDSNNLYLVYQHFGAGSPTLDLYIAGEVRQRY